MAFRTSDLNNGLATLSLSGKQAGSNRSCSLVIGGEVCPQLSHRQMWSMFSVLGPETFRDPHQSAQQQPVPLDPNTFPYQVHICVSSGSICYLLFTFSASTVAKRRHSVITSVCGVALWRDTWDDKFGLQTHGWRKANVQTLPHCAHSSVTHPQTHTPSDSCISLVLLSDRSILERERRSNGVRSALPEIPSAVCLRGGEPPHLPTPRCEVVFTRDAGEGTWGTHQRFISMRRPASRPPRCFLHPIKGPVMWPLLMCPNLLRDNSVCTYPVCTSSCVSGVLMPHLQ